MSFDENTPDAELGPHPAMTEDTFTCDVCRKPFAKLWADAAAYHDHYPECGGALLCTDCYDVMTVLAAMCRANPSGNERV